MQVFPDKVFPGVVGELELIGSSPGFVSQANATNSLTPAIRLTKNWIGPSDSVEHQQPL